MHAYVMTKRRSATHEDLVKRINAFDLVPVQVYGNFDVIVEVDVANEEDLYDKYIRSLNLIEEIKCTTYLAVKTWSSKSGNSLLAYILISVKPPSLIDSVYESLHNMHGIEKVSIVLGEEDIIASVAAVREEELNRILESIAGVDGVYRTSTLIKVGGLIRKSSVL